MDAEAQIELTANIVAAYVENNTVAPTALAELIASVHATLGSLGKPSQELAVPPTPAVPIKKSVTPDYIISLEDGKQYRTLKRHIARLGMTPAEYRSKWKLPSDYPMTAANYSAKRSELAKTLGLGRKRQAELEPAKAQAEPEPAQDIPAPKKRGRPKKNAA